MTRKRRILATNPIREALKHARTFGQLEQIAGIDTRDRAAREAFWNDFKHLPGGTALVAAAKELRRRIEAAADAYGSGQCRLSGGVS